MTDVYVVEGFRGTRITAIQQFRRRPVVAGRLEFFTDDSGKIRAVSDTWREVDQAVAFIANVDTARAVMRATMGYPGYGVAYVSQTALCLYPSGGDAVLAWAVLMKEADPDLSKVGEQLTDATSDVTAVYIDAHTAELLDIFSISCHRQWFDTQGR